MEDSEDDFEVTMEQAMMLDSQNDNIMRLAIDRDEAYDPDLQPRSSNMLKPDAQFPHLREYRDIWFHYN